MRFLSCITWDWSFLWGGRNSEVVARRVSIIVYHQMQDSTNLPLPLKQLWGRGICWSPPSGRGCSRPTPHRTPGGVASRPPPAGNTWTRSPDPPCSVGRPPDLHDWTPLGGGTQKRIDGNKWMNEPNPLVYIHAHINTMYGLWGLVKDNSVDTM